MTTSICTLLTQGPFQDDATKQNSPPPWMKTVLSEATQNEIIF